MMSDHKAALAKAEEAFDKCSSIRNSLEAACLAYAAALPVMGWRPISEAPKGACVLIWYCGAISIAWKASNGGNWMDWRSDEVLNANPSVWMPLPVPPENPS